MKYRLTEMNHMVLIKNIHQLPEKQAVALQSTVLNNLLYIQKLDLEKQQLLLTNLFYQFATSCKVNTTHKYGIM
jgi:hypothetical protein